MSDTDIVGHKTVRTPDGTKHEPLTRKDADAIWARCEAAKERRAQEMPDEQSALKAMHDAYQRLCELGWSNAIYCPKDGSIFSAIEAGSTGVHECHYSGEWPTGDWQLYDGDLWPSRPILWRPRNDTDPTVDLGSPFCEPPNTELSGGRRPSVGVPGYAGDNLEK